MYNLASSIEGFVVLSRVATVAWWHERSRARRRVNASVASHAYSSVGSERIEFQELRGRVPLTFRPRCLSSY